MITRTGALLVLTPLALLAAPAARADCAGPADYLIVERRPGRVVICADNPNIENPRNCPDDGLLRQSIDDGEVVKITSCAVGDDYPESCFVDECVPAGRYRYGLATPFDCESTGAVYFDEFTVAGADASCTRTADPPAKADGAPWGDGSSRWVCAGNCGHLFGCGTASASVLGANAFLLLLGGVLWGRRTARRA